MGQHLLDPPAQLPLADVAQGAVGGEAIVAHRLQPVGRGPRQDVRHVVRAEAPAQLVHAGEDFQRRPARVVGDGDLAQADVAGAAVGRRVLLAEVGGEGAVPADGILTEREHLAELAERARRRGGFRLEHGLPEPVVGAAPEEQALGLEAVAAGAPGLLLVVLDRLRHAGVDDVAHTGPVDPHPEGDGGDHDVGALVDEGVLVGAALGVGQARVVGQRREPPAEQRRAQLVDLGAPDAVDDTGLPAVAVDGGEHLAQPVGARLDAVDQVRPIDAPDEHERLPQPQLADDVGAHLRGRRRRVGVNGGLREQLLQDTKLAVFRPEVVPPLADAVGLIDREEGRPGLAQPLREAGHHEPLGGDVEQRDAAHRQLALDGRALLPRLAAVEVRGGHARLAERVHLVLHQRDQGRDDDGEAPEVRGGRLVAERLAAARGQHDHAVAPVEDRAHRLFLQRQEPPVAPDPPERLANGDVPHLTDHHRPPC